MARVTSVTCTLGAKVNQGNYESTDITWSETVELEHGDDPVEERRRLMTRVHTILERQVLAFRATSSNPEARDARPHRLSAPLARRR